MLNALEIAKENIKGYSSGSVQEKYQLNTASGQQWFLQNLVRIIETVNEPIAPYKTDSRKRDAKLLDFVKSEPILSGVLSNAISIDKSRGWSLIGAEKQVNRYARKLHRISGRMGWRKFIEYNAQAWYSTNIGFISEFGYDYEGSPPRDMFFMSPTKATLTEDIEKPLLYHGSSGNIALYRDQFIHGNSMSDLRDDFNGLGFCAVDRALSFTRMMIGLNQHHLEKFNVAPPKGLLHITGITRQEWQNAMAQAEQDMQEQDIKIYKDVIAIMTGNSDSKINLVGLSSLPDNFDLTSFIEVIVNGYALAFNSSLYNFWLPASNSLGRGTEASESLNSAKRRGEIDFALTFQEQIQDYFMPNSVAFQFDDNNISELKAEINSKREYVGLITDLVYPKNREGEQGEQILTIEQAQQLLAEQGIIKKAWTNTKEDYEVSDIQQIRSNEFIERAFYKYPDEPLVKAQYFESSLEYTIIAPTLSKFYSRKF